MKRLLLFCLLLAGCATSPAPSAPPVVSNATSIPVTMFLCDGLVMYIHWALPMPSGDNIRETLQLIQDLEVFRYQWREDQDPKTVVIEYVVDRLGVVITTNGFVPVFSEVPRDESMECMKFRLWLVQVQQRT